MYFVSATRLRVRSIFFLIGFMRANEASVKFLLTTPGFAKGKELTDKGLVFWTVTVWKDEAAMKVLNAYHPQRAGDTISVSFQDQQQIAIIQRLLNESNLDIYLLQPKASDLEQLFIDLTTSNI